MQPNLRRYAPSTILLGPKEFPELLQSWRLKPPRSELHFISSLLGKEVSKDSSLGLGWDWAADDLCVFAERHFLCRSRVKVQRWQTMAKWTFFDNNQFYIWEFAEDICSANRHCLGVLVHLELWDCWICQQELCDPGYWLGQSPGTTGTHWTSHCESLTFGPERCNSFIGTTQKHHHRRPNIPFKIQSWVNQGHDEAKPMLFLQGQLGVKSLNTKNMNQTRLCGPEILLIFDP